MKLEYLNISSKIHNFNSTLKIIYLFFYLVICIFAYQINYILLANMIIVSYLMISSKVPITYYIKGILKMKLIIIALYIICASFNCTFLVSTIYVLSFIFGYTLYELIIFTTSLYDLTCGIYNIVKYFNIFSISKSNLIISIYNLVYLKKDYILSLNKVIDSLENKGIVIRNKNIISRFYIKLQLTDRVLNKIKIIRKKRKNLMIKNKVCLSESAFKVSVYELIILMAFILLIIIYVSKVI